MFIPGLVNKTVLILCHGICQETDEKKRFISKTTHRYEPLAWQILMNRLISLQITDSVYRLTMLSIVSADNIEAIDSESDDRIGAKLLGHTIIISEAAIMTHWPTDRCPPSQELTSGWKQPESVNYPNLESNSYREFMSYWWEGVRFKPESLFISDEWTPSQIWYKESGLNPMILESNDFILHLQWFYVRKEIFLMPALVVSKYFMAFTCSRLTGNG